MKLLFIPPLAKHLDKFDDDIISDQFPTTDLVFEFLPGPENWT